MGEERYRDLFTRPLVLSITLDLPDFEVIMKDRNTFSIGLEGIALLMLVLTAFITKGVCALDNSTSKSSPTTEVPLEKRKTTNNNAKANDIDLGVSERRQIDRYESAIVDINELKKELEQTRKEVKEEITYVMRCNENTISSVNTSISGASYMLVIFTIVLGIVGILLGVYITLVERKVRNLTNESKNILETHLKIKNEVEKIDKNINRNMTELYSRLKQEETRSLVERLVNVPEDVHNLFANIASRDVSKELFPQVKQAYQKLGSIPGSQRKAMPYLILFFQHFAALALFDKDLEEKMQSCYGQLMNSAFKNDIIKTSCEFLVICMDEGILHWRQKILDYLNALAKSAHQNDSELHTAIYKTLTTKENRFNFYSILNSEDQLKELSKIYGQYILSDYKDVSGNTESEKLVLEEIAQIDEQEKQAINTD